MKADGYLLGGLLLFAMACDRAPEPGTGSETGAASGYAAEIRRTAYGVPHIEARDWGSLGFGSAYAAAEDNVCLVAELVLTAAAERARFFGEEALASDLYHRLLIERGEAEEPGMHPEAVEFLVGATAGFNQYLKDVGVSDLPDPSCRGAAWVREITLLDLLRLHRISQFARVLSPMLVAAVPPGELRAAPPPAAVRSAPAGLGSNAVALGAEATASGNAMFLGNPHQPWFGSYRFYMKQLTIPGVVDMIGASPVDRPFAGVGHNCCLAWNGTVSRATRHSFYRLRLAPGRPTAYVFDGEVREMEPREVAVRVKSADGSLEERRHTFWFTHFGPVLSSPRMPWTPETAWALRHVDAGWRSTNSSMELVAARTVREAKEILDRHQGWPVNFIAADHTGEVLYADPGAAAHLEDAQLEACEVPGGLDGSRSECQWGSDPDAVIPGIFGPSRLPFQFRRDWVANSNDSYWLTQPSAPLEGFPRSLGSERTERSLRTRIGIRMIQERIAGSDGRPPGFTLEQLQELIFENRDLGGELLRDELLALCRATPRVTLEDGAEVDLGPACQALAGWDLRADVDSRGAHLFREFLREGGARYRVAFDPADPVGTPRGLAADDPEVLRALGRAVRRLEQAEVALDARLGDVQYVVRGDRRIPIHGGPGHLGIFNAIRAPLEKGRYGEVVAGSSFIMAVELTPEGPVSRGLVTYSQSVNPESPHYADQTELFSRKGWVELAYRREDVLAAALRSYTVRGERSESAAVPTGE